MNSWPTISSVFFFNATATTEIYTLSLHDALPILPNPPATVTTTWSMLSGPGAVTFGNANALSTTASFSTAGSYTLRLTASDSVLTTVDDVVITVNPAANQPPVVSAGADQAITLPATAPLSGTATDDGLPNPPATVTTTWSMLSGPGAVTFGNANALSTTASFSTAGSYTLRLTASDSVLTTVDDVVITVNPAGNQAPVVSAGADQTITLPATAPLSGTATDDGLPNPPATLTTTWSMLSGPGAVTFSNANELSTTASFSTAGSYTLRLTASDRPLIPARRSSDLVNPAGNQAPVVSAGADQAITLPATAPLSGTATDDGLPNPPATVTTTWSMLSGPGTVTFGNANALSTTASFSTAGSYTLRLTASDSALTTVDRSEEHTSELQSLAYLVCRLLLEKKKKKKIHIFLLKKKKKNKTPKSVKSYSTTLYICHTKYISTAYVKVELLNTTLSSFNHSDLS